MTHEPIIRDVSDTAYWVAHYRAQETGRADALFRDPFAARLVGDRGRKIADSMPDVGRYTAWSVISRTVIIDRLIQAALKDGADAIINLGAGLDSRPYRMDLPETLEWIEADHPTIIAHKNQVLRDEKPRCTLTRAAVDLADAEKRRQFLDGAAPQAKKVLILTEGVIPYLSPEQVAELAADLFARPRFAWWITEYFHPNVYRYLKRSVRTRAMQNSPFRFYPDDWYGFFAKTGWIEKETRFSGEIAVEFNRTLPMPRLAMLLMPLLPKKVKEQALRMTGYVVFRRSG